MLLKPKIKIETPKFDRGASNFVDGIPGLFEASLGWLTIAGEARGALDEGVPGDVACLYAHGAGEFAK